MMNICKWCNKKVSDHDTVWYRRNLILGYSFCSTKCATQWKNSNQDSQSKTNDSSHNLPDEVSSNENFDFGGFMTRPKPNGDLNAELKSIQALQNQLRGQKENDNISDQENAKKIMFIFRKLLPHLKIIVPVLIGILAVAFYLNTMYGQILSYILIVLIISLVWAYFTEPKK